MTAIPPRVAVVLERPVQHFSEAFRKAAASDRIALTVVYWSDNGAGMFDEEFNRHVLWDFDLLSGYPSRLVTPTAARPELQFARTMRSLRPDLVVCFGWATRIARLTIAWCLATRTRIVFYGDTSWQHGSTRTRRRLQRWLLRGAHRMGAGAVASGTFNREFYIGTGFDPRRIVDCVYPIDVDAYAGAALDRTPRAEGTGVIVGFAGKLIHRKGADELLRALGELHLTHRWTAHIIGDGEERASLEGLARTLNISDQVTFRGFRNVSEMPSELAKCDIVVVPSRRDNRGMIAAEAMAAGAAVVVSTNTGVWGRGDLVEDGVTGRIYRSGRPQELAEILAELIDGEDERRALQEHGGRRAADHGPAAFSHGLEAAVAAARE